MPVERPQGGPEKYHTPCTLRVRNRQAFKHNSFLMTELSLQRDRMHLASQNTPNPSLSTVCIRKRSRP